jgi:TRAP-type C4-dicarboxylate transport system permease small subunit
LITGEREDAGLQYRGASAKKTRPPLHVLVVCRESLCRVHRALARIAQLVSVTALVTLTVFILAVAAGRLMFVPLNMLHHVALLAGVWLAMVGAGYTQSNEGHVSAGLSLERFVRGPVKAVIAGTRVLIITSFLILTIVTGSMQTEKAISDGTRSLDVLGWPVWPGLIAIPVGALVWLVVYVTGFAKRGE